MKVTRGHLTATEKKHIKAILNAGLTAGKIGRKDYHLTKDGDTYTVKIAENDRGIGLIGAPLRLSVTTKQFKV